MGCKYGVHTTFSGKLLALVTKFGGLVLGCIEAGACNIFGNRESCLNSTDARSPRRPAAPAGARAAGSRGRPGRHAGQQEEGPGEGSDGIL